MHKPEFENTGITNCTPNEFAAGGFVLFGGMFVLMGLMPFGFAVFVAGSVVNHWIDSTQEIVSVDFSGEIVSPGYAICVFVGIALVLFAIGAAMLWLGKLVRLNAKSSNSEQKRERAR